MATEMKGRKAFWKDEEYEVLGEKGGNLSLRGNDGALIMVERSKVELLPSESEIETEKVRAEIKRMENELRSALHVRSEFEHELREHEAEATRLRAIIARQVEGDEVFAKQIEDLKKTIEPKES